MYNDWASAEALFKAVELEFSRREWNFELVLVDDGSREGRPPDFLNSLLSFKSVEVVALRRNIGHQRAIAIGLSHIFETKKTETVVVMDADGEDRPEDLVRLVEAHSALPQKKIIFAERTRRSEGAMFRFLYQIYRTLHSSLTGYKIRFGNFSIIPRKLLGSLVVDPNLWLHFAATVVSGHTLTPLFQATGAFAFTECLSSILPAWSSMAWPPFPAIMKSSACALFFVRWDSVRSS